MKHFYCFLTPYFDTESSEILGFKLLKTPYFTLWYNWVDWREDLNPLIYGLSDE